MGKVYNFFFKLWGGGGHQMFFFERSHPKIRPFFFFSSKPKGTNKKLYGLIPVICFWGGGSGADEKWNDPILLIITLYVSH